MNFSFVLPSRGNWKDLKRMFDSFERTTRYKNKIEFLVAVNDKQHELREKIKNEHYSFSIKVYKRPHTKDFTNDYYNWLANRSNGRIIVAFNDDAWMRTNHWDKKILRVIGEFGTSIFCLDVPDTARMKYKNMFPCFPMVSRRSFLTLGFLLTPEIRMYPADKVTFAIYEHAQKVIPIRDVMIEHEHLLEWDDSKKPMMDVFLEDQEKQKQIDISDYIFKILLASGSDCRKKPSKFKRIINILKEK